MNRLPALSRRSVLQAIAMAPSLGVPALVRAQTATLRITSWGGRWGDAMRGKILPAFENEYKCKVEIDSSFPWIPKLMASPRSAPIYDVFHANANEQAVAFARGLVEPRIDTRQVPNAADLYTYAANEKMVGVAMFTNAIGIGYRTDKSIPPLKSWKDMWSQVFADRRAIFYIPTNAIGQEFLMMAGQLYGSGQKDLEAAFAALSSLRPVKVVDFTATMERNLLAGEIDIGVIHDSGIYRYLDTKEPVAFASPSEGVLANEQVLSITKGTKVRELALGFVNYMLSPGVQKTIAEEFWYSPANRKTQLDERYAKRLMVGEEKVSKLIQFDWSWYLTVKDKVDSRVATLFRG